MMIASNENSLMSLYFFQNLLDPKIQLICSVSAHVNKVVPDIYYLDSLAGIFVSNHHYSPQAKYKRFFNFGQFTYRWVRLTRSHDIQQLHCFPHPHLNVSDVKEYENENEC